MASFGNISMGSGPHMWRLENDNKGRQTWAWVPCTDKEAKEQVALGSEYNHDENQNCQDLVFRRAQLKRANYRPPTREQTAAFAAEAARLHAGDPMAQQAYVTAAKGVHFYSALQLEDGHWPGDYGGPLFLVPGLVFASHFCSIDFGAPRRDAMIRYLSNHQNRDGGWGLHIEGTSSMYGTCLNYCALRILGVPASDERAKRGLEFIHANGTALAAPSWAKFWLSILGVYDWTGVNSLCPEMWLLPNFLPFAPNKFWCHSRMVFLPMSYMFGTCATVPISALTHELRGELFAEPYDTIDWVKNRSNVCPSDIQHSHSWLLDVATVGLNVLEPSFHRWPMNKMRKRSTDYIASYVHAEDLQTNHICIGPVNKVLNMCVTYHFDGANSPLFQKHLARIDDYLWVSEDGMKMQGYNGSQLWDTSFSVLAFLENPSITKRAAESLQRAYHYLNITQISEDAPLGEEFFRHINKGAWPFSTKAHGWAISDCTGDALSAVLRLHTSGVLTEADQRISDERVYDAVNILLSFQNADGGWATYENQRGPGYLEVLNASEVFDKLMVDYTYVECSSSALQGLINFRKQYPKHRAQEIHRAIEAGTAFIRKIQRPDGSWLGSWAVCFCYAAWFGVDGLVAAGEPRDSPTLRKACEFLLSKQHADGGWGESYLSCVRSEYVQHARSQIVHTGWALLALLAAEWPDREPLDRAAQLLISRQDANGDWPHESIVGVFNASCMITYMNYRNVFALKALNRYCKRFGIKQ